MELQSFKNRPAQSEATIEPGKLVFSFVYIQLRFLTVFSLIEADNLLNASQSIDDIMLTADSVLSSLTNDVVAEDISDRAMMSPVRRRITTFLQNANENNNNNSHKETMMSPTRRGSVIQNSNPDFINALTKVIGGGVLPGGGDASNVLKPRGVSTRRATLMTRSISASSDINDSAPGAGPESKEIKNKTTKSKLLQVRVKFRSFCLLKKINFVLYSYSNY
jgi:hypothetical protein